MADSAKQKETQAKERVQKDFQNFIAQKTPKGPRIAERDWEVFRNQSLSNFIKAMPQIDRIIVPGGDLPLEDVAYIAVRTFAFIWNEIISNKHLESLAKGAAAYSAKKISKQARRFGATPELAEEIKAFFVKRHHEEGN